MIPSLIPYQSLLCCTDTRMPFLNNFARSPLPKYIHICQYHTSSLYSYFMGSVYPHFFTIRTRTNFLSFFWKLPKCHLNEVYSDPLLKLPAPIPPSLGILIHLYVAQLFFFFCSTYHFLKYYSINCLPPPYPRI